MNILFDIGGTKTRIAVSRKRDGFENPVIFETPREYGTGISLIKKTISEISGGEKIEKIAGGIAGPFSQRKSSLIESPNLSDWIGKPLMNDLEKEYGCEVHIENDSAMAGLGEAHFGAGKGFGIVAYITVSTGVGGARIVNGQIDERAVGFEPGHQTIDFDKSAEPLADGIYLGNYISGKGILKRTGKKPEEIDDQNFWENCAKMLAYGLNNTIVHWSPDVVVLGGSMINEKGVSFIKTREYLSEILKIYPEIPEIKKAELGDLGGLYGALTILK